MQGLEILVTTALSAALNSILLTVVWSLGVVRANFFASGHLVPGTASSKVKKNLSSVVQKNVTKDLLDNFLHRRLVLKELEL